MDLWQMRYFIQIYNDRSLTKAAKHLFISQQGLSKTIKNIEDEFQIPLFERSVGGIKPTKYGEILVEKSQKIINEYDELVAALHNQAYIKNKTISIGITNILYTDYLKTIINSFQEKYPDITLEFYELGYYGCEKHLDNNMVDICFSTKPDSEIKYEYIPVSRYRLLMLANKRNLLSRYSNVNISNLKNERFITLPADSKIRKLTIDHCLHAGFRPNIIITTTQLDYIIELIDTNKGITILPEFSSIKALRMSNNIAVVQFDDPGFIIEVGFILPKYKKLNLQTETLVSFFLKFI
jgi:Transcriptional regulator